MNTEKFIDNIINKVSNKLETLGDESSTSESQGTRLIFPKYRNGEKRVSEQELRQLFIEEFNAACEDYNKEYQYSIETPTTEAYTLGNKIEDIRSGGRSGCIDMCIHSSDTKRVAIIEFKANNASKFCHYKDFFKLTNEKIESVEDNRYFIQLIDSAEERTLNNLREKYLPADGSINLYTIVIGGKGIDNGVYKGKEVVR